MGLHQQGHAGRAGALHPHGLIKSPPRYLIPTTRYGYPTRFGWEDMEVGDILIVTLAQGFSARSAASSYKARHPGWDYTSEKLRDGRIRFWRLA